MAVGSISKSKQTKLEESGCVHKNYPFDGCEKAKDHQKHISECFRLQISKLFMEHKIREIRRRIWNKLAEEPFHSWCPACRSLMVDTLNCLNIEGVR